VGREQRENGWLPVGERDLIKGRERSDKSPEASLHGAVRKTNLHLGAAGGAVYKILCTGGHRNIEDGSPSELREGVDQKATETAATRSLDAYDLEVTTLAGKGKKIGETVDHLSKMGDACRIVASPEEIGSGRRSKDIGGNRSLRGHKHRRSQTKEFEPLT